MIPSKFLRRLSAVGVSGIRTSDDPLNDMSSKELFVVNNNIIKVNIILLELSLKVCH